MGPGACRFSSQAGFQREQTPAVSTLHLVFKRLDREAFEAALQELAQEELGDRAKAVAIDGKGLRGIHGEELPGVHLVALYGQQLGLTPAGPPKRERHLRAGSAQSPITRM